MIMNESGIHTFCLKRKYSYSEIQNIIVVKIGMSYLPTIRSRSTNPGALKFR